MKTLILTSFLAFTSVGFAFTLTASPMLGWDTRTLTFHLNPTNCPADVRSKLDEALALWNSVSGGRLTVQMGEDSAATPAQARAGTTAETPVIVCDTAFLTTFSGATSGVAGVGFNTPNGSGVITSGALALNVQPGTTGNINQMDSTQVKVVMAHEIGHVLGLGHSQSVASLMYYSVGTKSNLSFSEDDVNGMLYLYGRNEWTMKDPPLGGCGTISGSPPRGGPSSFWICALMMLIPVGFWMRLRKLAQS